MQAKVIEARVRGEETHHELVSKGNGVVGIVQPTFSLLTHAIKFLEGIVEVLETKETDHGTMYRITNKEPYAWFGKEHLQLIEEEDFI